MENLFKETLHIPGGRHLFVSEHNVDTDFRLHWHSFFEIEIIISGEGEYTVNDVKYSTRDQNVFLLTTTDFHFLKINKPIKLLNISFDENLINEKLLFPLAFSNLPNAYHFEKEELERLVNATNLLSHENEIDGNCQKQLLQYILNCIFRKDKTQKPYHTGNQSNAIEKSLIYMEMHFKEDISLKKLAEVSGYNPTYFSELFKKITGKTYIQALNALRIKYAKTLLENGFSVADACFLSGFKSLSNFGVIFKKLCGTSPKEYKKHHANGVFT